MNGPDLGWDVAVPAGAELGERPFWDAGQACLMWVDITAGRLHRYRPGAGDEIALDLSGVALGAAAPRRGGGYVLATAAGFRLTHSAGQLEQGALRPPGMPADARFNDGACDPAGRFWAGTVTRHVRPGAGALYRLDPDGTVTVALDGVTESNGLGWSLDGSHVLLHRLGRAGATDPRVRIRPATGELGRASGPVQFPGGGPVPDGLVVDGEGNPLGGHLGCRAGTPLRTGRRVARGAARPGLPADLPGVRRARPGRAVPDHGLGGHDRPSSGRPSPWPATCCGPARGPVGTPPWRLAAK